MQRYEKTAVIYIPRPIVKLQNHILTMNNKVVTSMISAAALTGAAYAGPAPVVAEEKSNCGSWCDTLETIGTVYNNKENPYIQKVKFFGRAQLQYGYIDGEGVDGGKFNEDFEEVRRLRRPNESQRASEEGIPKYDRNFREGCLILAGHEKLG